MEEQGEEANADCPGVLLEHQTGLAHVSEMVPECTSEGPGQGPAGSGTQHNAWDIVGAC